MPKCHIGDCRSIVRRFSVYCESNTVKVPVVVVVVVVVSVIIFISMICYYYYYSYSKTNRWNHPLAVIQQAELQLPRTEAQLSTVPMAPVDTNVTLNSFCGNCGAPLHADNKFCIKCGAAVTGVE